MNQEYTQVIVAVVEAATETLEAARRLMGFDVPGWEDEYETKDEEKRRQQRLKDLEFELRRLVPYCLQEVPEEGWIVLNRYYKPVGFLAGSKVEIDYRLFPGHILSYKAVAPLHEGHCSYYFFDDGCSPWLSHKDCVAMQDKLDEFTSTVLKELKSEGEPA